MSNQKQKQQGQQPVKSNQLYVPLSESQQQQISGGGRRGRAGSSNHAW